MVTAPFPASALGVAVVWEVGIVLCGSDGGWRGLEWENDGGLGAVGWDAHRLLGGPVFMGSFGVLFMRFIFCFLHFWFVGM